MTRRHSSSLLRALAVTTAAGAALVAAAPAAQARGGHHAPAAATSPVRVALADHWRFPVGSQVSPAGLDAGHTGPDGLFHTGVPVRLDWTASPASAIDHYDLVTPPLSGGGPAFDLLTGTRATSWTTTRLDATAVAGGGEIKAARVYRLTATDRQGATSAPAEVTLGAVHSEQEDGLTYDGDRGTFPAAPATTGAWRRVTAPGLDAGAALSSSRRGDRVAIPVRTAGPAQIALEMTTGPRFGAVRILVDGRAVGTVDTRAPGRRPRVLVAAFEVTAGQHTVTLVNLATRGRPEVQLDGAYASG